MWIDRRLLTIGVGASLLLNAFLVGVIAERFVIHGTRPGGGGARIDGPLVPAAHVRALTPEERRTFSTAMTAHRPAILAAREAHHAARFAVVRDMSAPTFDRAKVGDDLAALRRANLAVQEAVNTALLDAMADLSAEARATLVAPRGAGKAAPAP